MGKFWISFKKEFNKKKVYFYEGTNLLINLKQNKKINTYPNPFNSQVVFDLSDIEDGDKNIVIFDILGRVVFNDKILSGNKKYTFQANQLSSGVYLFKVFNNKFYTSGKINLVK